MRLFLKITNLCIFVAKDISPKELLKSELRETNSMILFIISHIFVSVVVCLPRHMEGIFRSLHMRLESLGHFNVLSYIILSTKVSFLDLTDAILFVQVHFAYVLYI